MMVSNLVGIETEACILLVPELLVDQPTIFRVHQYLPVVILSRSTPQDSTGIERARPILCENTY